MRYRTAQLSLALAIVSLGSAVAAERNQEVIPRTEARDTRAIVKIIEASVNQAYQSGTRPAMRDAHAKGHGCVKATFSVDPNLPAALRQGVFARPRTYKAWIRFSNGNGTPQPDETGDGRGMAIKLVGVPGNKVLANERNARTQDFVMINYPVFFVRNVADYASLEALLQKGKADEFFAAHPQSKAVVDAVTAKRVDNMLEERYFSMSAYRLGDQYIKFSARPIGCGSGAPLTEANKLAPRDNSHYLRDRMATWLAHKDACFVFAVQPQTDPATQPVEDPTVVWDETMAPLIDVASIRIPQQKFDSTAQQTFCENLSFTPWHSLPADRPVGGINRLRKSVYEAISNLRHRLNHAPRAEPTGNETFE